MAPFLVAIGATLLVTPCLRLVAFRLGITDEPASRKFHSVSTPYLGGMAVAVGLLFGTLTADASGRAWLILAAGAAIGALGLVDDVIPLPWRPKVAAEAGVAAVAVWLVVRDRTGADSGLSDLTIIIVATAVIVLMINSFNLIDNIDAHAASVALASTLGLTVLAADSTARLGFVPPSALAGACLGFLFFNLSTRFKIFLGDSGSLMLGFLVSVTTISLLIDESAVVLLIVLPMLMLVPAVDTCTVVIDRRRHGVPVVTAGKDHLSHRLVSLGLSKHTAVGLLAVIQLSSALVGVGLVERGWASGLGSGRWLLVVWPVMMVVGMIRMVMSVDPYADLPANGGLLESPLEPRPLTVVSVTSRMNTGGISRHVASMAAGLRARGHRHLLIYGSIEADEGDMTDLLDDSVGPTLHLPSMRRTITPVSDLQTIWRIYRILRRSRPDAVITHAAKAGFVGRVAAFLARVPVIMHTYHGHVFHGYFSPRKTSVYLALERALARVTTVIVTLSPRLRRELVGRYRVGKVDRYRVIELGLPIDHLLRNEPASLRSELGLSAEDTVVGSVGRMVPIKDLPLLVRAFGALDQEKHSYHLVLAGDGESRSTTVELVAQLGLTDRVHFLGWRDDIANLMTSFDVLALTSRNEGTPVSIIEAVAAGTPVVATAVGGVPDLVGETGHGTLVEDRSPEVVADAIIRTAAKAPIDGLARREIVDRFGQERLVDEMERLLFDLAPLRFGRPIATRVTSRFPGLRSFGNQGAHTADGPG